VRIKWCCSSWTYDWPAARSTISPSSPRTVIVFVAMKLAIYFAFVTLSAAAFWTFDPVLHHASRPLCPEGRWFAVENRFWTTSIDIPIRSTILNPAAMSP
jgi:hypothetical protein